MTRQALSGLQSFVDRLVRHAARAEIAELKFRLVDTGPLACLVEARPQRALREWIAFLVAQQVGRDVDLRTTLGQQALYQHRVYRNECARLLRAEDEVATHDVGALHAQDVQRALSQRSARSIALRSGWLATV